LLPDSFLATALSFKDGDAFIALCPSALFL
jgi:hypothetical protein